MQRSTIVIASLVVCRAAMADDFDLVPTTDNSRPAFFDVGLISRHFAPPPINIAARSAAAPTLADGTEAVATTADLRFGMAVLTYGLLGVEAEVGRLQQDGSSLAGMYGVAGLRDNLGGLMIGAEIAGGWRSTRFTPSDVDHEELVFEPRARAEFWLAPQFSFGATAGLTISGTQAWMAGIYLGVHSLDFAGQ